MRVLLLLCLAWGQAWANIVYVDCGAGVDGAGTSFSVPKNGDSPLSTSVNWATIMSAPPYGIYFKEGSTCNTARVLASGATSFPNTVGRYGTSTDHIVIGPYNASTGALITDPTDAQRFNLVFDGTTRRAVIELFDFRYTDVIGANISGGTGATSTGMFAIGANGVNYSQNVTAYKVSVTQGATPTNTSTLNAFTVSGVGAAAAGAQGSDFTLDRVSATIQGTSNNAGVICSSVDRCNLTNSTINLTGVTSGGIGYLNQSTTDARAITTGSTVTGNTITGGQYGIKYSGSGTTTTYPRILSLNWSNNTLVDQTQLGIQGVLSPGGVVSGNTITRPAYGSTNSPGAGAGILFAVPTGLAFTGLTDQAGLSIRGNTITDAGNFGIWITGGRNLNITGNTITNVGTLGVNSYGRGIEIYPAAAPTTPAQVLTLGALTGVGISVASSGSSFASTDVDRLIVGPPNNAGACRITAFAAANSVTCDVIVPFTSTTLASQGWALGSMAHQVYIGNNDVSNVYGRQYTSAPGTEGIGIGLDDRVVLSIVESNRVSDTDFAGIENTSGIRNIIRGNSVLRAGRDPTNVTAVGTTRRAGIRSYYYEMDVYNNSVNCAGVGYYGISADNSTTTNNLMSPASGGIITARNNTLINCLGAGILLNANDVASQNSYYGNAANYQWMAYLTFSSTPTGGDLTTQSLDGASLTSAPLLVGGDSPTTHAGMKLGSNSPLRRVGRDLNIGNYQDAGNRAFSHPPSIGAWEVTSGDAAIARTAR
jgi:parallel beta-helix repeat protein